MRVDRRRAARAVVAAVGIALTGVTAAPAHATALTASLDCDGTLPRYHYYCALHISGGSSPYTTTWSAAHGGFTSTSTTSAAGICTGSPPANTWNTVSATVHDSAGSAVTVSQTFTCYYVAP
ncbi:MAG: hypothetical protein ACJ74O_10185 [Frankiaceae bacterium]